MSEQASRAQQLAERYDLSLSDSWNDWFDRSSGQLQLPGAMCHPVAVSDLLPAAPNTIWAGFMLPDSIPLLGNGYGDWICARVDHAGAFGELIYWYHGGGDWIPVGNCLSEAILHDAIDQFRSLSKQMLRGASESRVGMATAANTLATLAEPAMLKFLVHDLTDNLAEESPQACLNELIDLLAQEKYSEALHFMLSKNWATEAVACDLLDLMLQLPVKELAKNEIAERAEIPWFPEYLRVLFDGTDAANRHSKLLDAAAITSWPTQNWEQAGELAQQVMSRRHDLGWAATVAGWSCERQNDFASAAKFYWDGMEASSFTDQSVRFNSHAIADDSKFSIVRLRSLLDHLPAEKANSPYLNAFLSSSKRSPLAAAHEYWMQVAEDATRDGNHAAAYQAYFSAGWDMGVSRLSEYQVILRAMVDSANACGWAGRASVAQTHLNCLQART